MRNWYQMQKQEVLECLNAKETGLTAVQVQKL